MVRSQFRLQLNQVETTLDRYRRLLRDRQPDDFGVSDNQLAGFYCLYQERDGPLTLRRLQALGFNSIIFDTGAASVERDPNGTLHQKVEAFAAWVDDPSVGVTVALNEPSRGIAFLLIP